MAKWNCDACGKDKDEFEFPIGGSDCFECDILAYQGILDDLKQHRKERRQARRENQAFEKVFGVLIR